jgi:murein DD-endopeptidase MepM/ murein hydrolase activator NlpD
MRNRRTTLRLAAAALLVETLALAAVTFGLPAPSSAAEGDETVKHYPYYVVMDPPIVYPGAIMRLQVRPPAGANGGSVTIAGRRYMGQIEDGLFVAYFAVDIDTLPGPYDLAWDVGSRHGTRVVTVRQRRMDDAARGERGITKEDQQVEDLVRSHPRLVSLWNRVTLERYWSGAFQTPSGGRMLATFAMRRATEQSLGRPHTGVDLDARGGSDVIASGVGSVALVADGPGGPGGDKIVVIDHGFGLYTYYFGLGQVLLDEGDWVRRGAVLGKMGKGPLHFGARLAGAEVDPVSLPGIALKVPAVSGEKRTPKEEKDRTSDYDF